MLKDLITEISYNSITLSDALTRSKLIASKVKDEKLKYWITNELLGYTKKSDSLPDYRILNCTIEGTLQHINGFRQKQEFPLTMFGKDFKKKFQQISIARSITDIESISQANAKAAFLIMPFDINQLAILNNFLGIDMEEEAVTSGGFKIYAQDFKRIIDITKQKLIDVLLQLHDSFPGLENEFICTKENTQKVSQIVNNHINIAVDNKNNQTMSNDNYENKGQAIVLGPNANISIEKLNQTNYTLPSNFDYNILSEQLSQLKTKVISDASVSNDSDKFKVVGDIIEAEKATKIKDNKTILKHLATGGKWLLETAKEIGVDVAAEVIKKSMRL